MSDYEKLLLDALWFQAEAYLGNFGGGGLKEHMLQSDQAGAAFGVVTFDVMLKANTTERGTLSGLKRLEKQGKVLSYQSRKGGMYRWWPVGFTEAKRASCSQTAKKSTHEVGRVDETGKSEHVGGAA